MRLLTPQAHTEDTTPALQLSNDADLQALDLEGVTRNSVTAAPSARR